MRRTLAMLPALLVLSLGITLNLRAGLGSDTLSTFEQGLARTFMGGDEHTGTMVLAFNVVVFAVFLVVDRSLIHIGSVLFTFCTGWLMNFWQGVLNTIFPNALPFWGSCLLLLAGVSCVVLALAYYVPINLGVQPMDMVILTISRLTKKTYGFGMYVFSVITFILTLILGGDWGLGTVVNLLVVGKAVDLVMPRIRPLVYKLAGMTGENK